jgi:adenosylhomocysteine nucleosidase
MPPKVGLIAALEREIAPLARSLKRLCSADGRYEYFEGPSVCLVCAGGGGNHAAAATRWVIASLKPEGVMSVGFAGALVSGHRVGDVITPGTVIDDSTGEAFSVRSGRGVLVSVSAVLAENAKRTLAARHVAEAADMEAASVARVAQENGIPFFAVKAISDEVDFTMPPMERFVNGAGKFQTSELLAYAAFRPALWPVLARLGANAKKASSQLSGWLENQMSRDFHDIWQAESTRP